MANNRIQIKRTSVSGRTANVTSSGNSQYIAAGELALNMADGILYSSNGSALIAIGSNNVNIRVTGNATINAIIANASIGSSGDVLYSNGAGLYWAAPTGGSGSVNTAAQFTWTNNNTFNANLTIASTGELIIAAGAGIYANGSLGTANQVLTTDGSSVYWSTPTASGGSISVAANNTTSSTLFLTLTDATSGNLSAITVSNTKLYFVPSTGTLSSTDYVSLSDKNKKTNINIIENALDKVCKLNGVSFDWREDGRKSYGLIAQEVEEIIPEVVTTDPEGIKRINYNALSGFFVEAIKELNNRK